MKHGPRWLARQLAELWALELAPRLVAGLPPAFAWRSCRALARLGGLYPEPVAAALASVPMAFPGTDLRRLARDVRSIWLLDIADLARSRRRPVEWLPRDLEVHGAWPTTGGFIAAGFHYGAGLWAFRHLRASGHRTTMLLAPLERTDFDAHPLRYRYARARIAELERIGGEPIIHRPGARARMLEALRRDVAIIGLFDVPPRLVPHGQRPVRLLGRDASLPGGMLALAAEAGVPVVPYWVEIDMASGRRRLVIGEMLSPEPAAESLQVLAQRLEVLIRNEPAAWLLWNEWPSWLRDAALLEAAPFPSGAAEGRLSGNGSAAGRSR